LIERILLDAGVTALDSEIDEYYVRLREEDGSAAIRAETERRLESNAVDVESLSDDFVTYQAIR